MKAPGDIKRFQINLRSEPLKMPADERSHTRISQYPARTTKGLQGSELARFEGQRRAAGGNAIRAAILGANNGLVSVFSLVMWVAGAGISSRNILITGMAGLLAGALSMAFGEWLSVQSQRELALPLARLDCLLSGRASL